MNPLAYFAGLDACPNWVPWRRVFNPQTGKFDKIPHNGRHMLSTKTPDHWLNLAEATEAASHFGMSGVGFVMTGGIEVREQTLVGLDFDDVDFDTFELPFDTYFERSPSRTGLRAFAWVPSEWAKGFSDTVNAKVKGTSHVEVYFGTSPRFLTVTFDVYQDSPITLLDKTALKVLESWDLKDPQQYAAEVPMPNNVGTPLNLARYNLSPEQQHLVEGTGKIDRSNAMHGFLLKLIDAGAHLEDILATLVSVPALKQYLLDHRNNDVNRAFLFAQEEIGRSYQRSERCAKDKLVGLNAAWKPPITDAPTPDTQFPIDLYDDAPGLVGEIAHWISDASYMPRPEFSYACALSMLSCLVGPYCVHGSRDGKMNLYICLVGETGTGKNEAFDTMGKLLAATDARDCMSDFPASEAALRRQLNVNPNVLIRADELAHKLESMQNSSALGKAILEMFNCARLPPKQYADERKSLPAVENPYVQILGGTTDKIWKVVKSSHLDDGTLNRFIFVCLEDPEYVYNPEPAAEIPKGLLDRLNAFFRQGKQYDLIGMDVNVPGRKIDYTDDVKQAVETLNRSNWDALKGEEYGSIYTRFVQNTLKIAALLALGDGKYTITMKEFGMARRFLAWSVRGTHYKIKTQMADTYFEKLTKRFLEKLRSKNGRMSAREAYRYMHVPRREMEELTMTLVMSGEIVLNTEPSKSPAFPEVEWIYLTDVGAGAEESGD